MNYKYLLIGLLGASSGFTMEKPADLSRQRFDFLSNLPEDLQFKVSGYLTSGKTLEEVVKNIRSLTEANKTYNEFLNDPQVVRFIISHIAKQFNTSELAVAFALKTKGSKAWIDEYISKAKKDNNFKQEFANILQGAIIKNDIGMVKYIVSKLPSLINEYAVDENRYNHSTPLNQAIRSGRVAIVEYLFKK